MGIFILLVSALGIFVLLRATLRAMLSLFKRRAAPPIAINEVAAENSTADEVKSVWAEYEIPAFIRRGNGYPVLCEKKAKRVRKVKPAPMPVTRMGVVIF
jgi:archaeosine-15-forming tRNA-guanine transglycosylase